MVQILVSQSSHCFWVTSGFDLPEDLFDAYLGEGMVLMEETWQLAKSFTTVNPTNRYRTIVVW